MTEGFERPEASLLPEDSLVPAKNRVEPPANVFSHVAVGSTPFYYDVASSAVGHFPSGTKLLVVNEGPDQCTVIDKSGLYVVVNRNDLRSLDP